MPSARTRARRRVQAAREELERAGPEDLVPPTLIVPGWKAKIYAAELNRLGRIHGSENVTKRLVVEEAKDKNSPLHDYFDWNLREAAMKHWLSQAGQLIRTVRVTYLNDPSPQRTKQAIVSYVRDDGQRAVKGILSALGSAEHRQAMFLREAQIIRGCRDRLRGYNEMIAVLPQLTLAVEQIEAAATPRPRRRRSPVTA